MLHDPSRRAFVRTAAVSAAALATLGRATPALARAPRGQARAPRGQGANDRMQLAIIGFGKRANELHGGFLDDDGIEIIAVADVAAARAIEGTRLVNERRKAQVCRVVASWRDIIANPAIDAVIVATPDHWHAEPAIAAALAGKHVYCEKPLSLTIAEGRAIADAARKSQICFQTGSQQRSEFDYNFVRAAEAVRNGRIGKIKRITIGVGESPVACDLPAESCPADIDWDGWLGQAPMRPFNHELCPIGMHGHYPKWRNYREYANGGLADMGAHHFDIAQWALLAVIALAMFSIQATSEELAFRGYLLPLLASRASPIIAVLVSTTVFTVGHPGSGVYGTIGVAAFALMFSLCVLHTATVSYAAGAHVANNMAMFLLFPTVENDAATLLDLTQLIVALIIWFLWVRYRHARRH